ncbi:MAG: DUF4249 domain-containing protein [Cytophagales bacterium]|nr:DUF4249 domain-containing protein [Cytophagales bacterium]
MNGRWVIFSFFFALIGCVEPITIDPLDDFESQLIVEGWINDVDEMVVVRLGTSTPDGIGENTLGPGAIVTIESGTGEMVLLDEVFPGLYSTASNELVGVVGESYTLNITLKDDRSYISEIVTIPEPVEFGSTRDVPIENRGFTDDRTPFVSYSNDIFTELQNTEDEHFVRIETSGWANLRVDYQLEAPGPLTCWQIRDPVNREIILANNTGVNVDTYEIEVTNVPVDIRMNYIIELYANAMSPEAFIFWLEAQRQLERGGGVFDPPFAPVVGNIRNVNDPDEVVLGYFHAYARTMTRYCFSRLGIPGNFEIPILPATVLCTDFYAPAVFELPFDDDSLCN